MSDLDRLLALADRVESSMRDLRENITALNNAVDAAIERARLVGTEEGDLIRCNALAALQAADWNVTDAAARLGIARATLYRRLEAWGVRPADRSDVPERMRTQEYLRGYSGAKRYRPRFFKPAGGRG